MTIGERIKKARNLRGLTQKELGVAIGFSELTADVRMAQYEAGTRVPKEKVLFDISQVLDVSLDYLKAPAFATSKDIMLALMEFDDYNETSFEEIEYINQHGEPMKHTGIYFNRADLESQLAEWANVKKELVDGVISLEEYEEWKTNWPATSKIYSDTPKQWKKEK
ncbi:MAG TPA: helix-turn-helix transcriptional regulator [Ruminiclostridium sp.]|nr:helix-turn-helix transcriptional regulator [Ruminiclostridium sp.]